MVARPAPERNAAFVRAPHLVCYWTSGFLVVYNFATGAKTTGTALVCQILDACSEPSTLREIAARCPSVPRDVVEATVRRLRASRCLRRVGEAPTKAERAMDGWRAWSPAAGFFHMATRDVVFDGRIAMEGRREERLRTRPMPPPVKRYAGAPVVKLPEPLADGELPRVLRARRTWRKFSAAPVPLEELALVLALTAGIHAWLPARAGPPSPLRTSPSGGARHAIEVYVVALRVSGLARGLYHYSSDRHVLERVRRGVPAGAVARYLPEQPWYEEAPALILFSALFERSLWRYGYARAYRALLIEAGHLCQTFCLAATWRSLAPFCSMALADSAIDGDLGLDGISESVLYAAGVGMPRGPASTARTPPGVKALRPLPNPVFVPIHERNGRRS
jgi:SagB-type dehydrogenase family enzyme